MAGISGGRLYDFESARNRIVQLTIMYRAAKRANNAGAAEALETEIDVLEKEISKAHRSVKGKMTTVTSSGHPVVHIEKIVNPIVPQWDNGGKREMGI